MKNNEIKITGAKVHNLKNVSLSIPREKLVVLTGLSGSGKSSLAFDTIYAEGRKEVDRFFLDYQSKGASKNGVELVIIAAMFYASILEGGRGTLRRKYQVISGATNLMGSLANKYGADLYTLDVWRNAAVMNDQQVIFEESAAPPI